MRFASFAAPWRALRWPSWLGAVALAGFACALVVWIGADSARLVDRGFPGFLVWDNGALAALHDSDWTGVHADLPFNGGVVDEVDGNPFQGGRALLDWAARLPVGHVVHYRIESPRGVRTWAVPTMRFERHDWWTTFGAYLAAASLFFALGVVSLSVRPDRPEARALALAMTALGTLLALSVDFLSSYRMVAVTRMAEALTPAALLNLALVFPVQRLRPRWRAVLVGAASGLLLLAALLAARWFYTRPTWSDSVSLGFYATMAAIGLAFLASLCEVVVRARDPEKRLRAAVVLSGSLVAFGLPAIAVLAFALLDWSFSWSRIALAFSLFPASVLYAILRHDLLEVERFVRTTLGYVLATGAVVVGYIVLVAVTDHLITPGLATGPWGSFALLLGIALAFDPLRRRVQVAVDRALFRSDVDLGRILEEASMELTALAEVPRIATAVPDRLVDAVAVEWAVLQVAADVRPLARRPSLVEPVRFRGETLGVLAVGEKRSGAPFSEDERDLVRGLAAQAAVALHNARSLEALDHARQALLRSARLAAVGEFSESVAHGIRNPLAGIRAAAQLAHQQTEDGALRESLAGVMAEVDRLEQRIRTLLDFSRAPEPRPRDVDLCAVLDAVARSMQPHARASGVALRVETDAAPLLWRCDADTLEEALLELVGNALRAMSRGGHIRLAARREASGVVLEVEDDGPGIPGGLRERVFDLFFTTRADGTGLGLATVKKSVEAQGGRVELARTGPAGTTFRIELPPGDGLFGGAPGTPGRALPENPATEREAQGMSTAEPSEAAASETSSSSIRPLPSRSSRGS